MNVQVLNFLGDVRTRNKDAKCDEQLISGR